MLNLSESVALKINSVSVAFDGFQALNEVDISVARGTIHFLIGPNGAGKTTLLDIICGKTKASLGTVMFFPRDKEEMRLTSMKEYQIVREGVCRKFQVPSVFTELTVLDNMMLSLKKHKGIVDSLFRSATEEELFYIDELLTEVNLLEKKEMKAGALAHGEKQWLEIVMQLVQKPELIMLDEPVAGMGKADTLKTGEMLRAMKRDCTILVVEHDMEFVKQVADVVTVLHEGAVLAEGRVEEVLTNSNVQSVYLGRGGKRAC